MALATRSKEPLAPVHGKPCSIGVIYDAVADQPAELAELNVILYEEGKTQAQVYEILTKDGGFKPGVQSINKHRGKNCRCFQHAPFRFCHDCRRDIPSCVCS